MLVLLLLLLIINNAIFDVVLLFVQGLWVVLGAGVALGLLIMLLRRRYKRKNGLWDLETGQYPSETDHTSDDNPVIKGPTHHQQLQSLETLDNINNTPSNGKSSFLDGFPWFKKPHGFQATSAGIQMQAGNIVGGGEMGGQVQVQTAGGAGAVYHQSQNAVTNPIHTTTNYNTNKMMVIQDNKQQSAHIRFQESSIPEGDEYDYGMGEKVGNTDGSMNGKASESSMNGSHKSSSGGAVYAGQRVGVQRITSPLQQVKTLLGEEKVWQSRADRAK